MTNRFIHPKTSLSSAIAADLQRNMHEDCIAVWITAKTPVATAGTALGFLTTDLKARSVLLIHEGTPLDAALLDAWRTHLATKLQCEIRCLFVRGDEESNALLVTMKTRFANLLGPKPEPEASGLTRGQWIKADNGGHNSMRLTMFFDSLGELLTSMDAIKQRFRQVLAAEMPKRKTYLDALYEVLENPKKESAAMQAITKKFAALENRCDQLPRVLLFGETGVGKTLFANYLGGDKPVDRISIAEFANKEDMFEYAFFGHCKGAFTDARDEGDPGLLLNNIGGVVFLDEIGSATPAIQAKLLRYLDDFQVRPRGSRHTFFCPTLVVAATNEREVVENQQEFRHDLLQRFTDIHPIPPLRKMKHNFGFILDALLQNPGINPDYRISEIGQKALATLTERDYKDGNFRELGNTVREACRQAAANGRHYVVAEDIENLSAIDAAPSV